MEACFVKYTAASAGILLQCLVQIGVVCFCQRIVSGGGQEGERLLCNTLKKQTSQYKHNQKWSQIT